MQRRAFLGVLAGVVVGRRLTPSPVFTTWTVDRVDLRTCPYALLPVSEELLEESRVDVVRFYDDVDVTYLGGAR